MHKCVGGVWEWFLCIVLTFLQIIKYAGADIKYAGADINFKYAGDDIKYAGDNIN